MSVTAYQPVGCQTGYRQAVTPLLMCGARDQRVDPATDTHTSKAILCTAVDIHIITTNILILTTKMFHLRCVSIKVTPKFNSIEMHHDLTKTYII